MMSEDDVADYRQQTLEIRERNRLYRMGQRGGPDAPEPCEPCGGTGQRLVAGEESGQLCAHCGGNGSCMRSGAESGGVNCSNPQIECPHCNGTGRVPFGLLSECPRCLGTGVQA